MQSSFHLKVVLGPDLYVAITLSLVVWEKSRREFIILYPTTLRVANEMRQRG